MAYTTVSLVSAELNGLSITSTTTPSSTTVETWISQAEEEINLRTGRLWESTVYSDEVYDANGGKFFKFPYAPIISVSTLEYEVNGLGADSTDWSTLTEGRTNDFILHVQDGEIEFTGKNKIPSKGVQNIKATFTAGYATTPAYITRLATAIVASRIIQTVINDTASEGGGSISVGNISISESGSFTTNHFRVLQEEVSEIYGKVGDTWVYRPSRVYDLR